MNKKKIFIIIYILIFLGIIITPLVYLCVKYYFPVSIEDFDCAVDIKPVHVNKIGEHIYYPEEFLFVEGIDSKEEYSAAKKYFEFKDKGQTVDVFVDDYHYSKINDRVEMKWCYAYSDGAIIDYAYYYPGSDDEPYFKTYSGDYDIPKLKKEKLKDPEKLIPKVALLASKNINQMYMGYSNEIYGYYLLRCDNNKNFYYDFVLNNISHVRVHAYTGNIINYEFKDYDIGLAGD